MFVWMFLCSPWPTNSITAQLLVHYLAFSTLYHLKLPSSNIYLFLFYYKKTETYCIFVVLAQILRQNTVHSTSPFYAETRNARIEYLHVQPYSLVCTHWPIIVLNKIMRGGCYQLHYVGLPFLTVVCWWQCCGAATFLSDTGS